MFKKLSIPLILCFVMLGCDRLGLPSDLNSTEEVKKAREAFVRLIARDWDYFQSEMIEQAKQANMKSELEKLARYVPPGESVSSEVVGWRKFQSSDGSRSGSATIQYQFPDGKWVIVDCRFLGNAARYQLGYIGVTQNPISLQEYNAVTFLDKSFLHYLFLTFTLCAVFGSIYACVQCIRAPGFKRKWLWAPIALFGVFAYRLDWTTGDIHIDKSRIDTLFLSASIGKASIYSPLIVSCGIPVGAILVLLKRRKYLRNAAASVGPISPSEPPVSM